MRLLIRTIQGLVVLAILIATGFLGLVWFLNYHPAPQETMEIIRTGEGSIPSPGDRLKVLSWNVQYMAGKSYVFYYDMPGFSGPDKRPESTSITRTIEAVAALIDREKPDIVLLQEMDEGASRTDMEDQAARLQSLLKQPYPFRTEAFYHKSRYIPHPMIQGSVGLKLTTLSRFPIREATRHQLSLMPQDWISQQFYLKRCVLECRIPLNNGTEIAVLNTHLDAFSQGTDTLKNQVSEVIQILEGLDREGTPWIIGGDFNLLPPGQHALLPKDVRLSYQPRSELTELCNRYQVFPTVEETTGSHFKNFFTHFPNNPSVHAPDRTIDYIFRSANMKWITGEVIQQNTWSISDHLPLLAQFIIPE